jgi:predicted GNAT family acetyltransferase
MMSDVEINPAEDRFELAISGSREVAAAYYRLSGDRFVLTHTIVPERFSGRGIGTQLARGVFRDIRENGRKVILVCSFMVAFYERHPEYADIVVGSAGQGEAA